jgi:hypothetical protein
MHNPIEYGKRIMASMHAEAGRKICFKKYIGEMKNMGMYGDW